MNKAKSGFEGFVYQVGKVVLYLLCALDVKHFVDYSRQIVHIFIIDFFLGLYLLNFETHISTDSSHIAVVLLQVIVHFH